MSATQETSSPESNQPAERRGPTMKEAREILDGLFEHRPLRYWTEFLLSSGLGWAAMAWAATQTSWSLALLGAVIVAALAFLRSVLFLHEITHFRRGVMTGFENAWNLFVGIPMLIPSFMYVGTHTDHHKRHLYGTIKDPEYLPLGHFSHARIIFFLVQTLAVPGLLVLRFGFLGPLSWALPPLRRLLIERASTLAINPDFKRAQPDKAQALRWVALEIVIFAWLVLVGWLLVTEVLPLSALGVWYGITALLGFINQVRTLTAHLYQNEGEGMSTEAQLLDSVNVLGLPILTELAFPVGLKFHALHHFVPDMPYHSLPEAHRRLMKSLPEGSLYRDTEYAGALPVIFGFWRETKNGGAAPKAWKKQS